jgi:hypothetical protein
MMTDSVRGRWVRYEDFEDAIRSAIRYGQGRPHIASEKVLEEFKQFYKGESNEKETDKESN